MVMVPDWAAKGLEFLASLFVLTVGLCALTVVVLFFVDIMQTKDAVRRNYPVLGRFRYLFTSLGEFFRQYFFAMDREELPFNRAEREWAYRAARGESNTSAFGSTRNLTIPGTPIFVNCPFPTLDTDAAETMPMQIGPYCRKPFMARSLAGVDPAAGLCRPARQGGDRRLRDGAIAHAGNMTTSCAKLPGAECPVGSPDAVLCRPDLEHDVGATGQMIG